MSTLTELDLNAPFDDYLMTMIRRYKQDGTNSNSSCPANGVPNAGDNSVYIPPLLTVFQDKIKIVHSQKERFSPQLFSILEKIHFENLLPFEVTRSTMSRKEATDILIAYAEEFHRLEQSNQEVRENIRNVEKDIYHQLNAVYTNFINGIEEIKTYSVETRNIIEKQKETFHKDLNLAVDDIMDEIDNYKNNNNKRFLYIDQVITSEMHSLVDIEMKYDELKDRICLLNQEIKDIQMIATKRMNQLEVKLTNQIIYSNISCSMILLLFVVIHYVLSNNISSQPIIQYPLLPTI